MRIPDSAGQRQRQDFCAGEIGRAIQSSSVNETCAMTPLRFTVSPHDVQADSTGVMSLPIGCRSLSRIRSYRPAWNRDTNLRPQQVARKRLKLASHFHRGEIARIESKDIELRAWRPNCPCSRFRTPDSSAKSKASIVPVFVVNGRWRSRRRGPTARGSRNEGVRRMVLCCLERPLDEAREGAAPRGISLAFRNVLAGLTPTCLRWGTFFPSWT